ncbi:alpha/beta fold hydrolase [Olivibacter domesticus]|uniref:Pimeloyl-ACP methyl ester carboxylesterase n=1 Tax=Olivibacter domesticus TaxID=407022 RepID=A0A1H7XDQ9_OLID1|nr:alpha/beta hydrolase [Olivibacter domesticus]SEM31318.1 Pimeloyl-ACP methyl ester carboxylesterase [Olivibacter domesticus]
MELTIKEDKGYKYIDEGEGEVLLMLHGLMGALSNWEETVEGFKGGYRVIIPMLPIYELPILSTGIKSLANWLEKFVNHLKLNDFVLVGNSLGGHIALMYVVAHQKKIKALVLAGSSGLYENSFGGSFPRRESYDFIKERVEFTFYAPETATKELVDEVFATVNNKERVIKTIAMAKSAIRHNMAKELPNIKIRVGLIWGKNDKITPPDVAEEFLQLLPNASLTWIDQCGHAPMMEQPKEFNSHLKLFLDTLI